MAKRGRPATRRSRWGSVRLKQSGNYQATYWHGGIAGVMRGTEYHSPQTFQTEADARVWLASERRLIERGEWTPPAQRVADQKLQAQTLHEYASRWLEQATMAPTSKARYTQLLHYYIEGEPMPPQNHKGPARPIVRNGLGTVPLNMITRLAVAQWWRSLPLASRRRSCDMAYSLLHTIMAAALDDELITEQPCRVKGAGKPSMARSIDNPLTPAQVQQVADAMAARWRLGVLLGSWLALRSGEIRELRRRDIDLDNATIKIRRAVVRVNRQTLVTGPKTEAGKRDVPIPAAIIDDIRQHLKDYAQIGPDGLLFYMPDGSQVTDSSWRKAFRAACKSCGVAGVRFHDLRHIGLTYAAGTGATVKELQQYAGHTTPAVAMRYQEIAQGRMAALADGLSAVIKAGRTA